MKTILRHIDNTQFTLAVGPIQQGLKCNKIVPSHIVHPNKKTEWINTRLLIDRFFPNLSINYNQYGAPQSDKKAISISHCNEFTSFIVSNKKAAIDIEKISDKPLKIAHKFLSLEEQKKWHTPTTSTICWSAKECLFKLHQKGQLNFSQDLKIKSIEEKIVVCSIFNYEIKLFLEKFNDHILVYYYE